MLSLYNQFLIHHFNNYGSLSKKLWIKDRKLIPQAISSHWITTGEIKVIP